jgi:hypothetical protein
VSANTCPSLKDEGLSSNQVETLYRAFEEGRESNLSYSLAAIAFVESSGGLFVTNPNDPSSSVLHITTRNALVYAGWEDTEVNREVMYEILQHDFETAAHYAIINLNFWKRVYGGDWRKVVASYNAGYRYDSKEGQQYMEKVVETVKVIRLCKW